MPTGLGIDFGNDSVKLAVVRTGAARTQILAACKIDRPFDAREAGEGDLPPLPPDIQAHIKKARARRGGGLVGLSGRDLMMKYASVPPVPPWKMKMLMEYEIRENQATGLTDICSDFRLLNVAGRGLGGNLLALIAIARNSYLRAVLGRAAEAGLKPVGGCPAAIGLFNAYRATGKVPEKETVFLLDIGHRQLETAIIQNGELLLARSTPGGGEAFSGAIDSVMKVGPERADGYKRERAQIMLEPQPDAGRQQLLISTGLREAADAIFNAVRSAVMFCRVQTKNTRLDIDRLVISGGGARMKGLREYLEGKLGKPVSMLDPAEGLDLRRLGDTGSRLFDEAGGEMAVAVGLAVADADPEAWKLELLPEEFVARQRFWRQTVWACAAAALLAVSLGAGYFRANQDLAKASGVAQEVSTRLQDYEKRASEFADKMAANDEVRAEVELLRSQTRFGVTVSEFLRLLRSATPEGVNVERLLQPGEPDEAEMLAGQIALSVEGRVDKTRVPQPFEALNEYMAALKAEGFVVRTQVTTKPETVGGSKPGDENRLRFSFRVTLDPSMVKNAAGGNP